MAQLVHFISATAALRTTIVACLMLLCPVVCPAILTLLLKLTVAIERNLSEVGRAHGIYVNSALDGFDLHLLMSLVFTNKEYSSSTLEIQGADRFYQIYREVSVVLGTRIFRLARGYTTLETVYLDIPNSNAIIRWNVIVFHY